MDGLTVASSGSLGPVGLEWHIDQVADLDGDFRADILWRNDSGALSLWVMDGLGVVDVLPAGAGVPPMGDADPTWGIEKAADFDGDSRADLLWRNGAGDLRLWLMDGAVVSWHGPAGTTGPGQDLVAAADRDGDGGADILWRNVVGGLSIWFMDGSTTLLADAFPGLDTSWGIGDFADFDGDGGADILWRKGHEPLQLWMRDWGLAGAYDPASVLGPDWAIQNSR
jgi:hypothetical protein